MLASLGVALTVTCTGGLVALIWLTQSLRFVELVVNRGLSFRVFFELTALLVPNFIAVILPITTFVVVQFVYQRLSGDRELRQNRAPCFVTRSESLHLYFREQVVAELLMIAIPINHSEIRTRGQTDIDLFLRRLMG